MIRLTTFVETLPRSTLERQGSGSGFVSEMFENFTPIWSHFNEMKKKCNIWNFAILSGVVEWCPTIMLFNNFYRCPCKDYACFI